MLKDIHFGNPSAAYFFLVTIGIGLLFFYSLFHRNKALRSFATTDSLQKLLYLERRTFFRYGLLITVWSLATFALMQPEKVHFKQDTDPSSKQVLSEKILDNDQEERVIVQRKACDMIILLDASASMEVPDTRTKISRLDYAKEIVDEIIGQMDGQNIALYAFTSNVTPLVPPTLDYLFTRLLLRNVKVNEGDIAGTDLFEAMDYIQRRHLSGSSQKQKVIVLLTDGGDTRIERLEGAQRQQETQTLLNKTENFKDKNVRLFTIGLGTKEGQHIPDMLYEDKPILSSLDTELLSGLSQKGRGRYYFANDHSALHIAKSIVDMVKKENIVSEEEVVQKRKIEREVAENKNEEKDHKPFYQFPLGLAALCLALELLLPKWPTRRLNG